VLLGFALGLEMESPGLETFSWSARLVAQHARGSTSLDSGLAHFSWSVLGIELCPLRVGYESWSIRPCALALGGALEGEGEGFVAARSKTRSFWGLGALLRARHWLGTSFGLEAWGGGILPLVERQFVVDGPTETLAESPRVAALAGLSFVAGVR
jgi:hypothetical protein